MISFILNGGESYEKIMLCIDSGKKYTVIIKKKFACGGKIRSKCYRKWENTLISENLRKPFPKILYVNCLDINSEHWLLIMK